MIGHKAIGIKLTRYVSTQIAIIPAQTIPSGSSNFAGANSFIKTTTMMIKRNTSIFIHLRQK